MRRRSLTLFGSSSGLVAAPERQAEHGKSKSVYNILRTLPTLPYPCLLRRDNTFTLLSTTFYPKD